jgi:hypothetical protein
MAQPVCGEDNVLKGRLLLILICCLIGWLIAELACGQNPPLHYLHRADLPSGTVARSLALHRVALQGHFQPVKLQLPSGARVSLQVGGQFDVPQGSGIVAGMLVGSVYQLKITGIPFHEGLEVYPTIELLSRLYPPPGRELQFPVPIEFTQEDLELALSGLLVTRVIYLEDPDAALAAADAPNMQRSFDVAADQDPLFAADRLGRPMAILRMGSRVPELGAGETDPGFGCPPVLLYTPEQLEAPVGDADAAVHRYGSDVPRIPLPATPSARRRSTDTIRR